MKIEFKLRNKKKKRVGRGISAGGGKTAGRGTKGQKSRTGKKIRIGFEGGQNPLARRLPKKRGFKSTKEKNVVLNVSDFNVFKEGTSVNINNLIEKKIINKIQPIKVLGTGKLDKKLKIEANFFSEQAKNKIKKAGGEAIEIK